MNLEIQKAIANLDSITSIEDPDELKKLDANIQQLFDAENAELGIDALLRVFERFPNQDGHGVFWSIVHSLESLPNYEEKLIESVKRQPSEFGLLMLKRMLNAGITKVKGINLLDVLKNVAADETQMEEVRSKAQDFIKWQESERQESLK